MLRVEGLTVRYGPLEAVRGVSLALEAGEALALIGPNGAGKTSVLRGLLGLARAEGRVVLEGEALGRRSPEALLERGVVLVPEGRALFPGLSVEDNLLLGGFRRFRRRENLKPDLERVYALFPRLLERRRQPAGTLSGGEQQMLAIGRALMARPRILLLDEPSLGLAPLMVREIYRILRGLKEEGTTLLLVEQNAKVALALADRGVVLEAGEVALAGRAEELRQDPKVVEAYLGLAREVEEG
ncbi:MAG: ABC transporter ATP-binding protein [Thermus sp.]|uniref:ABC transporter ATP-binding protein n=1 Tax=unclassified Thermus TaxID=2619321 RepID=UPI000238A2FB|nr:MULTISPECIES: ABC transporter ATP-binding protein [unclassified Thermus]AEV16280.1 ABC transporter protein [Thermus sp. CCB_US3_UF1]MCS7218975.1 ABC transporter ATP-binding protein [Thermus sp.]MCX7850361.1 ABC transporter ATP-binding protein [Thermus sp.]MDW8018050.1 ABC transporter ATP-binding protein [Thermus sp.]MDW8358275.1 ABC transporter ATP-binding protein [Thermus sp.]